MEQVIVRYKVKPERVEENEELVRAVYAELDDKGPRTFHYATFKLADGVSFVHVSTNDAADGQSPLPQLAAFNRFQANIDERCDERPVVSSAVEVGSYRWLSDLVGVQ
jgi:hypothetical protein